MQSRTHINLSLYINDKALSLLERFPLCLFAQANSINGYPMRQTLNSCYYYGKFDRRLPWQPHVTLLRRAGKINLSVNCINWNNSWLALAMKDKKKIVRDEWMCLTLVGDLWNFRWAVFCMRWYYTIAAIRTFKSYCHYKNYIETPQECSQVLDTVKSRCWWHWYC